MNKNPDITKNYYKISEVAAILGIPASTLRYWEKEFTIVKPKRTGGNARLYTPDDVEVIKIIYYLVKEKGLKIDAAQEQIRRNRGNVSKHAQVVDTLKEIRDELREMIKAIDSQHRNYNFENQ